MREMAGADGFEAIDIGYELAPLRLTLGGEQVKRYALAARMPGGRFMSDAAAKKEGLPGQIVPGNLSLALFSQLISRSLPGSSPQRMSATFRGLVRPGSPLVIRGVVTEKHSTAAGEVVECDLVLESADGERWVTGTASVRLPAPQ